MKSIEFLDQLDNKWNNVYWFARMLINTDKYGNLGKNSKLLSTIITSLKLISLENKNPHQIFKLQKETIRNILEEKCKKAFTKQNRVQRLITDLEFQIKTQIDMEVFIVTCENIMIPINEVISRIPNDDKEFTLSFSKSFLDKEGEKGLATVINF